jgi:hypothetical protein
MQHFILVEHNPLEFHTTGIHSPKRSAKEDMLLVLFSTAISNLVSKVHTVVIIIYMIL